MTRILVIDDEPSVRELLSVMLMEEGYEVVEAADGEAGMRLFRENPADLVITDLIMPEKGRFQWSFRRSLNRLALTS